MKKYKILAIAPYEGLKHLFNTAAKERDNIIVDTFVGDLSDGVQLVKNYQDQGYDIILSRGGTAQAIEEIAKLPVIDVSFSSYDMIRAIRLSKNFNGKKAILGFPKITEAAKIICSLIQFDIDIFTIYNEDDACKLIEQLVSENYELIIGDTYAACETRNYGFKNILITTGKESVESVFNQVSQMIKYTQKQQEQLTIFKGILSKGDLSYFVFDDKGDSIIESNCDLSTPKNILIEEFKNHIPQLIASESDILFEKLDNNTIYEIKGSKILFNEMIYLVFCLKTKSNIPNNEHSWLTIKNKTPINSSDYSINIFDSTNHLMQKTISVAKNASKRNQPIILLGEEGTGKNTLASFIYSHDSSTRRPLLKFDCQLMDNDNWDFLFNNNDSPLYFTKHYLYFNNINYLCDDLAIEFIKYLKNYKENFFNRLIVSYSEDSNNDFNSNLIINYFIPSLNATLIRIPSLSERKEDIPSLINSLINECNVKYGKQIVGLEEDAQELLQSFTWSKNFNQLTACIRQLASTTNNSFISKDDVNYVLGQKSPNFNMYNLHNININQSLEKIEKDIIKAVLKEEDFNQTKAASRLNISRATIWRKLKNAEF